MLRKNSGGHILIVDEYSPWGKFAYEVLVNEGYTVSLLDSYELAYKSESEVNECDLIILSCSIVKIDESELVDYFLRQVKEVVVVCSALSSEDMRRLFIAGANDVTDKPYDKEHIISLVENSLSQIYSRDAYETFSL